MELEIAKGTIGREAEPEQACCARALCLAGPVVEFDSQEGEVLRGPTKEASVSDVRRDCWP